MNRIGIGRRVIDRLYRLRAVTHKPVAARLALTRNGRHIVGMPPTTARLADRALIDIGGPDWRGFLQGLLTQDVVSLAPGEIRFAALLTPQGRILFDLFVIGADDGCRLDCAAHRRDALIARLGLYRLRAKVEIAPSDAPVAALWGVEAGPSRWLADPRLPALGWRGYGLETPGDGDYLSHRLAHGVPGEADWGAETTYPIEADFDLLKGVDFKKGCFVGQETTSRMKRRGAVKSRMAPVAVEGPLPPAGTELLAGTLRAGQVLSGAGATVMALLRLDRADLEGRATAAGHPWRPVWPDWFPRPSTP
jgi:hypothetical protein